MSLLYWLAALAYLLQIVLFVMMNAQGSYSLTKHAVSDYGVGAHRQMFAAYGWLGIVAAIVLAAAILSDARFPTVAGIYLLAMAALRIGVLRFPTDLEGDRPTRTGRLHYVFAIGSFALAYMAIDALHPATSVFVQEWTRTILTGLRWVVTASLVGVVVCLIPQLRGIFGLVERVFLLTVMLWLGLFAMVSAIQ